MSGSKKNDFYLKKRNKKVKVCLNCIYDEDVDQITFDEFQKCNYCYQTERLKDEYGTGRKKGEILIKQIFDDIKKAGEGKKYDCVVGVSGGTDSSYLIYLTKKVGLKPLAVHYDNTWNTEIATMNIKKVLNKLNVDLYTKVINNKEMDDIYKSFFLAGVAEIDSATDLGYATALYQAAEKYKVKYILEGHSFVAEGITPIGKNYFDGRYIKSIHKIFGEKKMSSYPLMSIQKFLYWTLVKRIRKIRPFWYINYSKENAQSFLSRKFGWKNYGGHHLENKMTKFLHTVYAPEKFNSDFRNNTLSALVRNKKISRLKAWKLYNQPFKNTKSTIEYFKKRLNLSDTEYKKKMSEKPKFWFEYPTYKKTFEMLSPLFNIMQRINLVPKSFYMKYCKK